MGLFSGDGAGMLGRLLQQYGAEIIGGLHLKMPDSIGDEKVLKRPLIKNKVHNQTTMELLIITITDVIIIKGFKNL